MVRKLNIAVNNDVMSIYDLTQGVAKPKRIQVYVRFPVTPSVPYLYSTEGMTTGAYTVEEFLEACQKTPIPTAIGAYVRFRRPDDVVTTFGYDEINATIRRSYIGPISYNRFSGGRYTPTIFCRVGNRANIYAVGNGRVSYSMSLAGQQTGAIIDWRTNQ